MIIRRKSTLLGLCGMTLFATQVLANPPSAIHADYDLLRQELNITVQHPVAKPTEHFIKKIVVFKNGKEIVDKNFEFQTSHRNQTMIPINIAAQPGDRFKIVARCNKFGSKEKTIEVTAPPIK